LLIGHRNSEKFDSLDHQGQNASRPTSNQGGERESLQLML
jgi:hypothetical protein